MRHVISAGTLLVLAATMSITGGGHGSAVAGDPPPRPTPFAMSAFGLGTAVTGGEVPAESGKTSHRIIGCTNRAGVDRKNHEAEVTVPGLGVASGVKTRVWTRNKDGVVSSNSMHSIAALVIGEDSDQGTLELNALKSVARAYHDAQGFHTAYETEIGSIVYTPTDGTPEVYPAPAPGETLEIPGLASIKLGSHSRHHSAEGAKAYAMTLKIHVIPSDTVARVAHTSAKIGGGVKHGLFRGNANATRVQALDGLVTSGPTLGSITADGEPQEFPDPGEALIIPGVAAIETRTVEKIKAGIKVTSVRVTLLTGAVP